MRGKGEGSIYRREDGLWAASIELPPREGKRRRRVITAKTKQAVLTRMRDERKRLEAAGAAASTSQSQTVESWLNIWLATIVAKEVRPKTYANYVSMVNRHVIPTIGNVRLHQLGAEHLRRVADDIQGKGLSSTTALTVHRIMSSAFGDAVAEKRILTNPAFGMRAVPKRAVPVLEVLTAEEVRQFADAFGESRQSFLWVTFMLTGARRGEILGLTWDRVTDHLDLSWQLQRHPVTMQAPADYESRRITGGLYWTRPKTKAGWRIVPLVDPLRSILARWRDIAPANPYDLVFATDEGEPIDPDRATREWPIALKAAGIDKHVRLHDLRHTAVDLLYEASVPEDLIREIVGHSTREMTRAYKSRGNRAQLTAAMNRMAALLATPTPRTD